MNGRLWDWTPGVQSPKPVGAFNVSPFGPRRHLTNTESWVAGRNCCGLLENGEGVTLFLPSFKFLGDEH